MPALPLPLSDECFALLENTRAADSSARLYRAPIGSVRATLPAEVLPALAALEQHIGAGLHACGYISYEAGYVLQGLPLPDFAREATLPLLHFELFSDCQLLDASAVEALLPTDDDAAIHAAALGESAESYQHKIARIHQLIRSGDTYQINYTLPYRFRYAGSPVALYRALRQTQRVEFAALLNFAEARVLSLSPELFLRRSGNTLMTRPMKGTAPRGQTPDEDASIATALQNDPKSRAENLMIVDLLRNDLGRVAKTGSIQVSSLFEIESFETLHQMTSSISGELAPTTGLPEIVASLFPCGSITGAPKRRSMQIIAELEGQARGMYTGAIGYLAPDGDFCFNVPIRTVVSTQPGVAAMGVGSGIVQDSVASAEYAEVMLKTNFLHAINRDLGLIESMRLEADGSIPDLALHLSRLAATAQEFAFPFDAAQIRSSLSAYIARHCCGAKRRLRLLLGHGGEISLSDFSIIAAPEIASLLVSSQIIDSHSVFRRHKTTRRGLYDSEYERATQAGAYEVLFLNERGEVAEAARHNIFIQRSDMLLTPPVNAGALPGILRQQLINQGKACEAVLTLTDLQNSAAVFVGNAVRGLQRVILDNQDI